MARKRPEMSGRSGERGLWTLFGPVPSRRLGRSLGIDVIPPKTCTYDCIYCESGPTTHLTVRRRLFVPPEQVLGDLEAFFRAHQGAADALTFSAAGEPTLYEGLGELALDIKARFPALPLVLLTNGSLLWDERLRRELMPFDRVVPSLDAVFADVFQSVNRPHPLLDLEAVMEGIVAFRKEFPGELHLEVLLISGVNDQPDHLRALRRAVDAIRPDRVELNTVVRPPADPGVLGLSAEAMQRACGFFPPERTVVLGSFRSGSREGVADLADIEARILKLVERRPCTVDEMASALGVDGQAVADAVDRLRGRGRVRVSVFEHRRFVCGSATLRPDPS